MFERARNSEIFSEEGKRYIDFLDVAGSLNYGHNNPVIKKAIMDYLSEDRIINAMDMYTVAKAEFFTKFTERIMAPRALSHRIMCCGPTGTNAVEAAIKLARLNTKRTGIISFGGAFHGMTLGSLSLTTDQVSREGAGIPLDHVTHIPYDGTPGLDSIAYLKWMLEDDHSGQEKPAAIVLETVQAEGGINVAGDQWLRDIRKICDDRDILMIVDDIQVGNGRTGYFFSFERAGIVPDIIALSKSISGFGIPMALLLIKPEYDIFRPAQHNGTFRGNQLAFVGASAAVDFFVENRVDEEVRRKAVICEDFLREKILPLDDRISCRGIGLIWGIDMCGIDPALASECLKEAFGRGLICEVAGRKDGVIKLMPALTIEDEVLLEGLEIIRQSIEAVLQRQE